MAEPTGGSLGLFFGLLGLHAGLLGVVAGLLHLLGLVHLGVAGLRHGLALPLLGFAGRLFVLVVVLLAGLLFGLALLFQPGALGLLGVGRLLFGVGLPLHLVSGLLPGALGT